jgi:hypothetical protein
VRVLPQLPQLREIAADLAVHRPLRLRAAEQAGPDLQGRDAENQNAENVEEPSAAFAHRPSPLTARGGRASMV